MGSSYAADRSVVVEDSPGRFSLQLRRGTATDHSGAEHSSTMADLVSGELPLDGFVRLNAQLAFVYEELEAAADGLKGDPVAGPFVDERLRRTPSLRRDLQLLGATADHPVTPTAATARYCERIRSVAAEWSPGLVAHHYTRYLGDLSGGQHICRVVERTYGIDRESGSSFFHFEDIVDVDEFKNSYRAKLDQMPLTGEERRRFIDEVSLAYELSTDLFLSLD